TRPDPPRRSTSSPRSTTPSSRIRAPSSTTIPLWPSTSRSPQIRGAPRSRCEGGSGSTTANRSLRKMSSSATRTTGVPRPTSSRRRRSASRSSTTAQSASSSKNPSSTSRFSSGPPMAPVLSGCGWLEFPGVQDPKNPVRDKRVREAVSLAIDRRAINHAEAGGLGKPTGNWINNDVQYAIEWPEYERNIERAKQLMREAGFPNGFDVDWVTPVPPFYSRGERIIAQLREIGIRARLQTMERGVFFQRLQGGLKDWPGIQIIFQATRIAGSWSFWYEAFFKCGGFNSRDRICVTDLDGK